jgi:nitroreductase
MQLLDAIKKRRSVRRYSSKDPDWRKILKAIDAARYAPSAGNKISWKFILVSDKKKIEELAEASQQKFVGQAKYVVALVSSDEGMIRSYGEERGIRFARHQAGAAIENFLLALNGEDLVTCWIGHFAESQVKRVLGVSDSLVVEALFPIGIETKVKTPKKYKQELDSLIYFDKWGNKTMTPKSRVSQESI